VETFVAHDVSVVEHSHRDVLAHDLAEIVEREWKVARAERPELVDGQIFSVDRIALPDISGAFVPYRFFVAQCRLPSIYSTLLVQPLGVTGRVTTTDQRLVFGRRSHHTTQDPGRWELAPAGGVDASARTDSERVDPEVSLYSELHEELGVGPADVARSRLAGVVVDPVSHVHELVYDVTVTLSAAEVDARARAARDSEHVEFEYLDREGAAAALPHGQLAAATLAILGLPSAESG
jgi:8-oxo-dGTP pyrophosphatase MutT (NUDIX family)